MADDITLRIGLDTTDVQKTARQTRKEVADIFSKTSGKETTAAFKTLEIKLRDISLKSRTVSQDLRDLASKKVPTDTFSQLQKAITETSVKVTDLKDKMQKFTATGGKTSARAYQIMEYDLKEAQKELKSLRGKRSYMTNIAKNAYTTGDNTEEYKKKTAELQKYNEQLAIGIARLRQMKDWEKIVAQQPTTPGSTNAQSPTGFNNNSYKNWKAFNTQVEQVGVKNTERYAEAYKKVSRAADEALRSAKKLLSVAGRGIVKGTEAIGRRMLGIRQDVDDTKMSMRQLLKFMLKYTLGLRSIFILYKRLRSAGVEAYKGLASQFPELQAELNDLKNSFFQLKNSLATMAQPILSYLVPAIKTLMSWLTAAMNAIANFFAILTGAKYIYKAANANKDWAKSVGGAGKAAKEANEDIAEYDNLILIQQDNDNGGGGGSGAVDDYAGAFEKVKAESDLAKEIKDAINRGDWEGVGIALGKRLNSVTEKIDDWIIDLRPKAVKWASNIARVLNGLTDVWDSALTGKTLSDGLMTIFDTVATFFETYKWRTLGQKIGTMITSFFTGWEPETVARKIAGRFNAVIEFLAGLIDKEKGINFKLVGQKLGETLKRTIQNIEWKQLGADLSGLAAGILEGLASFLETSKVGETVGNAINNFLSGIDFGRLASDLSTLAINILNALADCLETVDWVAVGQAIADFLKNIDWGKFLSTLVKVALALIKGIGTAILQIATDPEALASIATPLLAIFGAKWIWKKIKGVFASGIGGAISGGIQSAGLGGTIGNLLNSALGKALVGVGTYEVAGKIGAKIAKAIFAGSDEVLAKEYDKFAEAPIKYTVNTVKEAWNAAKETSILTGQSTLSNAINDMFFGGLDERLEAFIKEQDKLQEEAYQKYLDMLQRRYEAGKKINEQDLALLKETGRISEETSKTFETNSNHYAEIAKKQAGVVSESVKNMQSSSNHYAEIAKTQSGYYQKLTEDAIKSSNHYAEIAKANAQTAKNEVDSTVQHIKDAVAPIPSEYEATFNAADAKMKAAFDGTKTYFSDVAEGVKSPFSSMASFFKDTFSDSWNGVVDVFQSNSPEFQSIQDSVSGTFKSSINSMIDGVNSTLVSPFSALNSMFSKLRAMSVGGKNIFSSLPSSIGFSKIPRLAQGAVLPPNQPFLAMVGDQRQGTNVEAPLDTIVQALQIALENSGNNNNQPIVLNLNGKQVAQAVWDEENKRYKQTGMRYKYS